MVKLADLETKPKRKSRGRGRSARQISLPSGEWILADLVVERGRYKDVSALFQKAFEDLMDKEGMVLNVKVEEIGARKR
ncbi:MAG: hypothetical protein UY32_C0029G0001 [Candidatus Jorgensenbacteria bacterium GW2011_GWC1_48_8]|uniref:Uncharacterized protein n=2 Tax=Candidatus Joergenseniibacteriota TaxID=1752739 RepID=A0A0G1W7D3_9BACT|nr:MAG: hypothetical protein UY32_C0029G0001 [Candidatus Jorgensenbacteria bacterium GW2011_GWC1_48_8]KKW14671.1 MAG: hypothetical protein UY55_C0005G0019 [Candidatus Jorgensenbacteria bacterium GW2011_GWB1_50_10]